MITFVILSDVYGIIRTSVLALALAHSSHKQNKFGTCV
jgi:hypothetical protein